jgi:LysM repeat protein
MVNQKNPRIFISVLVLVATCTITAGALLTGLAIPARAAPAQQVPIYTPTPGPDGRIIYIVKTNDTLLSISLLMGVPLDKLKALNNLKNDTIVVGQPLLLGLAGPAEVTFTPGPSPTPTPILPTPTPKPGTAKLCIILFNDQNGDSIRQETEPSIPEGAISVTNRSGSVSLTATTPSGLAPTCFDKVPEGDYNVSVAVPAGYNPTTVNNFAISLKGGDTTYLDFGAQANAETLANAPTPTGSGRSPILGILGGVLLLIGLGLAIFASRLLKGK